MSTPVNSSGLTHNQQVLKNMQASSPQTPAQSLRERQAKNLQALYESEKKIAVQQHEQIGRFIECGEYDAARLKAIDLQNTLQTVNKTANRLADIDG